MGTLRQYADTLIRLKPVQVYDRLRRRAFAAKLPAGLKTPGVRPAVAEWTPACRHEPSWDGGVRFTFLDRAVDADWPRTWDDPALPLLWRYNLHYFADLHSNDAETRRDAHRVLVERWIAENPPTQGTGWAPYPVSLRLRNWLRWWREGERPAQAWLDSAAQQAHWLERTLEYHLLGNHLLENAYALHAAGCCFGDADGDRWRKKGARLISEQLIEQVLGDGGHYERTAMYHSLLLEGLLDAVNHARTAGIAVPGLWLETAQSMLDWLAAVVHPDGEIPLLNDAAFGIAATPADLVAYAARLGIVGTHEAGSLDAGTDTGWVVARRGPWHLIADLGVLSPAYIAGHGHADTLCFELSVGGRRLVVDPGTSTYENSPARWYERSTEAHDTIAVDRRNSSNVWHAFRTGRQAGVHIHSLDEDDDRTVIEASQDGYVVRPGRPVHQRRWEVSDRVVAVHDRVGGRGSHALSSRWSFAPEWRLEAREARAAVLRNERGDAVRIAVDGLWTAHWTQGEWHPRFGVSEPVMRLDLTAQASLPAEGVVTVEFLAPATDGEADH